MSTAKLIARSLAHYWRTNVAVVLGVATAVSVLSGALLVGDSVRGSLRHLVLQRLGSTEHVVSSSRFFRGGLGDDLAAGPGFQAAFVATCPLIALEGVVTQEESGRRASGVLVYGVDERFWTFHGLDGSVSALEGRQAWLSEGLLAELGAGAGSTLLVGLESPSAIPGASLFGRREGLGRTLRLVAKGSLAGAELGEFSLRPQQQAVKAVFVPLGLLQRALERRGQVNALLVSALPDGSGTEGAERLAELLRGVVTLEDLGLRLRALVDRNALSLESATALIGARVAEAARGAATDLGLGFEPLLTYLANTIRSGERKIPYSLVTALDEQARARLSPEQPGAWEGASIFLNDWAAGDLRVGRGDPVSIEYYVWEEGGRLSTQTADFQVAGVVPLEGAAADADLTPEYPGITESEHLGDWDPPFPIDLSLVRPRDEDYWEHHRTTPKAFISLDEGQKLWRHRLGELTSVRILAPEGQDLSVWRARYEEKLGAALDPLSLGLSVEAVRELGLEASRGATDFGEYFVYFSFFLVVSALLLTGLFFRLGIERRLREVGLLRASGFALGDLRRLFLAEGLVLASLGSLLGMAGAWAYGGLMMLGLRTWWLGAVGTEQLRLHVTALSLALGVLAGIAVAFGVVSWTLRGLQRTSPRRLLSGVGAAPGARARGGRRVRLTGAVSGALSLLLMLLAVAGLLSPVAGFFGAGSLLLVATLCFEWLWLAARSRRPPGAAPWGVVWLGLRNASYRPGRSLLCIALVASATFIIVAVGAFRREGAAVTLDPRSGTGGYTLLAESLVPLFHDPGGAAGREALDLGGEGELEGVTISPFRLRPGQDASCLNLYRPDSPTLLAPSSEFLRSGRFVFQASLAETPEERANPWLLLERERVGGAIPVIGDANSMTYVLHRGLGDELLVQDGGSSPIRVRFVGALRDSLFQGVLLTSEGHFLRAFPRHEGYRFFLLDPAPARMAAVTELLESRLADLGFDVQEAGERLAGFHRVENTYLSTFQALGALGLLLGTLGLATVLVRNAFERRRELALLRAVGYRPGHVAAMITAENVLILGLGLGSGTLSALLAIAPAVLERGGQLPVADLAGLLVAVLGTGLLVSWLAVAAVNRLPLLEPLRAE